MTSCTCFGPTSLRLACGDDWSNWPQLCGVLGNVSDADAHDIIRSMPQFCATGATVIWTRTRRPPDLTHRIRGWFAEAGFSELAFVAPDDALFSVGMSCFMGTPQPLRRGQLFRFVR